MKMCLKAFIEKFNRNRELKTLNGVFSVDNGKLIKSTKKEYEITDTSVIILGFNMPAVVTCAGAGACKNYCFAMTGHMSMNQSRYFWNLYRFYKGSLFHQITDFLEIKRFNNPTIPIFVRIHACGDFFSKEYLNGWLDVAEQFPDIVFYGYTKCVKIWKDVAKTRAIPPNMRFVFSIGGIEDHLIEPSDRICLIRPDKKSPIPSGFIDGMDNDLVVATTESNICLTLHSKTKDAEYNLTKKLYEFWVKKKEDKH